MRTLLLYFLICSSLICVAQQPFSAVRAHLDNNDFKQAGRILDSCLKKNYQPDSALFYEALLHIRKENPDAAKENVNKIRDNFTHFGDVHYLRGLIYFKEKNYGKSINEFNEVLKTNPAHLKSLFNRALAEGLLEDYESAIEDLSRCIEIDPTFVQAWYSRGYWYDLSGKFPEAISDYEKTIQLDPKNYDAYLGLAQIFIKQKDQARVCDTVEKAMAAGSQAAVELRANYCK